MPRRKGLSPDKTFHVEVSLQGIPRGGSPLQFKSSRTVAIINGMAVPKLRDGWKNSIAKHFLNGLSEGELQYLEIVILNYCNERVIRTNPITWEKLLSELDAISAAAKSLSDELKKRAIINDPIWPRVWNELPKDRRGDSDLNTVRSSALALSSATEAALARARCEKNEGKGRTYNGPWTDLVNALADLFEVKGGKATAAKNLRYGGSAKPTIFVELVWTVMECAVPVPLREYTTASKTAMANAVSNALVRSTASKKRPTGPFRKFLDGINPVGKSESKL